jgi:hypothetical protein
MVKKRKVIGIRRVYPVSNRTKKHINKYFIMFQLLIAIAEER